MREHSWPEASASPRLPAAEALAAAATARERGLEEVASALERLVREAAAGAHTEQAIEDREREEWTSIVAHDLRQPVNGLNLWLGVLERQAKRAGCDLGEGFEHARATIRQLDRMISDLVDASRLKAHRLNLQRRPTELGALIREAMAHAGPELAPRLRLEPFEPMPRVEVDPARIEQVLLNLFSSSAKYGDPGTPITVQVGASEGELRISVVNRGRGLSAEDAQQLFGRSRRGLEARAGELSGLGLGLYLTRTLVEAHGGQVWVESPPGETTIFRFTLPCAPGSP